MRLFTVCCPTSVFSNRNADSLVCVSLIILTLECVCVTDVNLILDDSRMIPTILFKFNPVQVSEVPNVFRIVWTMFGE